VTVTCNCFVACVPVVINYHPQTGLIQISALRGAVISFLNTAVSYAGSSSLLPVHCFIQSRCHVRSSFSNQLAVLSAKSLTCDGLSLSSVCSSLPHYLRSPVLSIAILKLSCSLSTIVYSIHYTALEIFFASVCVIEIHSWTTLAISGVVSGTPLLDTVPRCRFSVLYDVRLSHLSNKCWVSNVDLWQKLDALYTEHWATSFFGGTRRRGLEATARQIRPSTILAKLLNLTLFCQRNVEKLLSLFSADR